MECGIELVLEDDAVPEVEEIFLEGDALAEKYDVGDKRCLAENMKGELENPLDLEEVGRRGQVAEEAAHCVGIEDVVVDLGVEVGQVAGQEELVGKEVEVADFEEV